MALEMKNRGIIVLLLVIFLAPGMVNCLFYQGEVDLKTEKLVVNISHTNGKARLNAGAQFTLYNPMDESSTVSYSYDLLGKQKRGEITLPPGEEKVIDSSLTKILNGPHFAQNIEFYLSLDGSTVQEDIEQGTYKLNFPQESTVMSLSKKPDQKENGSYLWSTEEGSPGLSLKFSWTQAEVDIGLKKKASPAQVRVRDKITFTYHIQNDDERGYHAKIEDHYSYRDLTPIQKEKFEKAVPKRGPGYWIYERKIDLGAEETKQISLSFSVNQSTYRGDINPEGFLFSISDLGYLKRSDSGSYTVIKCDQDGICEVNKGENYGTCSEDCPSGSDDGYCNLVEDGRCDPDCDNQNYQDPDCVTEEKVTTETIAGEPSQQEEQKPPFSFLFNPRVLGGIAALIVLVVVFALSIEPETR